MGDSRDLSRALHTSIGGLPKDWRRHPGCPRYTWLQTLEADLQAIQSWPELSMATRPGQRTLEAACGNGYTPVRGMPAMMMMMMKENIADIVHIIQKLPDSHYINKICSYYNNTVRIIIT